MLEGGGGGGGSDDAMVHDLRLQESLSRDDDDEENAENKSAKAVLDTAEGGNFQKQTQRGEELRRVMSELKKSLENRCTTQNSMSSTGKQNLDDGKEKDTLDMVKSSTIDVGPVMLYCGKRRSDDTNLNGDDDANEAEFCLDQFENIPEESDSEGGTEISEDEGEDGIADDEEYLFPDPDEAEGLKKPAVGMSFDTLKEAHRFVNIYGQLNGFSVFKGRNYKNKKVFLMCNKSKRAVEPKNPAKKRKRSVVKGTSCKMQIIVVLEQMRWKFTDVDLVHNHPLVSSPSLTKFFINHRYMTEEEKKFSRILQEARIKPRRIMQIFRKMKGNFKYMNFGRTQLKNLKQANRQNKIRNTDIDSTMLFVKKLQKEQPGFYYTMRTDEENTVKSIFWTASASRLNYKLYGDFVSFDTTFSTNKYNMPFAPLVGINGHGRTIVFGYALLENQKAETFSWLFNTLLEAMDGKKPELIITDQDAAMKKAISEIFGSDIHRNCFWHIMRNARENLGTYLKERPGMAEDLERVIYGSISKEEFDEGWKEILEKYDAKENGTLKLMWKCRSMWAPAYFMDVFCPFIKTTGRSESTNSSFKDYVMRKDSIETFLQQCQIYEEEQAEIERRDRFESNVQEPVYATMQMIERHAAQVYTRNIYLRFQMELYNSSAYSLEEEESWAKYKVHRLMDHDKIEFYRRTFYIEVDKDANTFSCICKKYQRDGILCCHILRLFTHLGIYRIPENYIKLRWTKDYLETELRSQKKKEMEQFGKCNDEPVLRHAMMMNSLSDMCSKVCKDKEKSEEFMRQVENIFERIGCQGEAGKESDVGSYKDPPVIQTVSVDKGHRLVRPSEQSAKEKRDAEKAAKKAKTTGKKNETEEPNTKKIGVKTGATKAKKKSTKTHGEVDDVTQM